MKPDFNSLAFRLFATAAAWAALVLPVAGVLIYQLYRAEVETSFNDRIKTLLTVIVADSLDHAGVGMEPGMPKDIGEPLFEYTNSGWYWQITPFDALVGRRMVSASLTTFVLPSPYQAKVKPDSDNVFWLDVKGPLGQPLRIAEMLHTFGDSGTGPQFSYVMAGPRDWPQARITAFRNRLAIALALVGLGLVAVTMFQVRFGLLPLRAIERGLAAIRSGEAAGLEGELPVEIQPLQHELNQLIQSNQDIIDRARTQVGNLAHALKTPLAVITNEARDDVSPLGRKVAEQAQIMRVQMDHYLERAQMAARAVTIGRVTEVLPVLEGLCRALERIYRDKGVSITLSCPANARFQGEKQDLEEMLGNLLDNACKWAADAVYVGVVLPDPSVPAGQGRMAISVEDNGPGLTEEQRRQIGKRGMRLDETKPGTGLGLSIVADLAQSYRGSFALEASGHGGLAGRLELPSA